MPPKRGRPRGSPARVGQRPPGSANLSQSLPLASPQGSDGTSGPMVRPMSAQSTNTKKGIIPRVMAPGHQQPVQTGDGRWRGGVSSPIGGGQASSEQDRGDPNTTKGRGVRRKKEDHVETAFLLPQPDVRKQNLSAKNRPSKKTNPLSPQDNADNCDNMLGSDLTSTTCEGLFKYSDHHPYIKTLSGSAKHIVLNSVNNVTDARELSQNAGIIKSSEVRLERLDCMTNPLFNKLSSSEPGISGNSALSDNIEVQNAHDATLVSKPSSPKPRIPKQTARKSFPSGVSRHTHKEPPTITAIQQKAKPLEDTKVMQPSKPKINKSSRTKMNQSPRTTVYKKAPITEISEEFLRLQQPLPDVVSCQIERDAVSSPRRFPGVNLPQTGSQHISMNNSQKVLKKTQSDDPHRPSQEVYLDEIMGEEEFEPDYVYDVNDDEDLDSEPKIQVPEGEEEELEEGELQSTSDSINHDIDMTCAYEGYKTETVQTNRNQQFSNTDCYNAMEAPIIGSVVPVYRDKLEQKDQKELLPNYKEVQETVDLSSPNQTKKDVNVSDMNVQDSVVCKSSKQQHVAKDTAVPRQRLWSSDSEEIPVLMNSTHKKTEVEVANLQQEDVSDNKEIPEIVPKNTKKKEAIDLHIKEKSVSEKGSEQQDSVLAKTVVSKSGNALKTTGKGKRKNEQSDHTQIEKTLNVKMPDWITKLVNDAGKRAKGLSSATNSPVVQPSNKKTNSRKTDSVSKETYKIGKTTNPEKKSVHSAEKTRRKSSEKKDLLSDHHQAAEKNEEDCSSHRKRNRSKSKEKLTENNASDTLLKSAPTSNVPKIIAKRPKSKDSKEGNVPMATTSADSKSHDICDVDNSTMDSPTIKRKKMYVKELSKKLAEGNDHKHKNKTKLQCEEPGPSKKAIRRSSSDANHPDGTTSIASRKEEKNIVSKAKKTTGDPKPKTQVDQLSKNVKQNSDGQYHLQEDMSWLDDHIKSKLTAKPRRRSSSRKSSSESQGSKGSGVTVHSTCFEEDNRFSKNEQQVYEKEGGVYLPHTDEYENEEVEVVEEYEEYYELDDMADTSGIQGDNEEWIEEYDYEDNPEGVSYEEYETYNEEDYEDGADDTKICKESQPSTSQATNVQISQSSKKGTTAPAVHSVKDKPHVSEETKKSKAKAARTIAIQTSPDRNITEIEEEHLHGKSVGCGPDSDGHTSAGTVMIPSRLKASMMPQENQITSSLSRVRSKDSVSTPEPKENRVVPSGPVSQSSQCVQYQHSSAIQADSREIQHKQHETTAVAPKSHSSNVKTKVARMSTPQHINNSEKQPPSSQNKQGFSLKRRWKTSITGSESSSELAESTPFAMKSGLKREKPSPSPRNEESETVPSKLARTTQVEDTISVHKSPIVEKDLVAEKSTPVSAEVLPKIRRKKVIRKPAGLPAPPSDGTVQSDVSMQKAAVPASNSSTSHDYNNQTFKGTKILLKKKPLSMATVSNKINPSPKSNELVQAPSENKSAVSTKGNTIHVEGQRTNESVNDIFIAGVEDDDEVLLAPEDHYRQDDLASIQVSVSNNMKDRTVTDRGSDTGSELGGNTCSRKKIYSKQQAQKSQFGNVKVESQKPHDHGGGKGRMSDTSSDQTSDTGSERSKRRYRGEKYQSHQNYRDRNAGYTSHNQYDKKPDFDFYMPPKHKMLLPINLKVSQNGVLQETLVSIQRCGRLGLWDKLGSLMSQLITFTDQSDYQKYFEHFASALMDETVGSDISKHFHVFLQNLESKRDGDLNSSEKRCIGTVVLIMMTNCLAQKQVNDAFLLLYLTLQKDIRFIFPCFPFMVHVARVMLTVTEICLTVGEPLHILYTLEQVNWLEDKERTKHGPGYDRIRLEVLREVIVRLISAARKEPAHTDIMNHILDVVMEIFSRLAKTSKRDMYIYDGYESYMPYNVLLNTMRELAVVYHHCPLMRTMVTACTIYPKTCRLKFMHIRPTFKFFYNHAKLNPKCITDAYNVYKLGMNFGCYPKPKRYDGKTGGMLQLWTVMTKEEIHVAMEFYLDTICLDWLNLGLERAQVGLRLSVHLIELPQTHLSQQRIWSYRKELQQGVKITEAIDKVMTVFKEVLNPPLSWSNYSSGIFHITQETLLDALRAKIETRQKQKHIEGSAYRKKAPDAVQLTKDLENSIRGSMAKDKSWSRPSIENLEASRDLQVEPQNAQLYGLEHLPSSFRRHSSYPVEDRMPGPSRRMSATEDYGHARQQGPTNRMPETSSQNKDARNIQKTESFQPIPSQKSEMSLVDKMRHMFKVIKEGSGDSFASVHRDPNVSVPADQSNRTYKKAPQSERTVQNIDLEQNTRGHHSPDMEYQQNQSAGHSSTRFQTTNNQPPKQSNAVEDNAQFQNTDITGPYHKHEAQFSQHGPQFPKQEPQFAKQEFAKQEPQFAKQEPQFAKQEPQYAKQEPQFAKQETQFAQQNPIVEGNTYHPEIASLKNSNPYEQPGPSHADPVWQTSTEEQATSYSRYQQEAYERKKDYAYPEQHIHGAQQDVKPPRPRLLPTPPVTSQGVVPDHFVPRPTNNFNYPVEMGEPKWNPSSQPQEQEWPQEAPQRRVIMEHQDAYLAPVPPYPPAPRMEQQYPPISHSLAPFAPRPLHVAPIVPRPPRPMYPQHMPRGPPPEGAVRRRPPFGHRQAPGRFRPRMKVDPAKALHDQILDAVISRVQFHANTGNIPQFDYTHAIDSVALNFPNENPHLKTTDGSLSNEMYSALMAYVDNIISEAEQKSGGPSGLERA